MMIVHMGGIAIDVAGVNAGLRLLLLLLHSAGSLACNMDAGTQSC